MNSLQPRAYLVCNLLAWLAVTTTGFVANSATFEVNVFDHFFEPFELTIHTGDTIAWTAYGYGHIVISDTGVFDSSRVFGSAIPVLGSYKFTFHEPGVYPYYSQDYGGPEGVGMSATVTVTGAVTNQIPGGPTNVFPANGASNQPIRVELRGSVFADGDAGDTHVSSEWLVRRVSDNQLVYDSGEVEDDGGLSASKTNRFLPFQLLHYGTAYAWQVRYKDSYSAWSPYSAATSFSTIRPVLSASRLAGAIRLVWPTNSAGFVLEFSTNSLSGPWLPAGEPPQVVGGQNMVSNAVPGALRIYRLSKSP